MPSGERVCDHCGKVARPAWQHPRCESCVPGWLRPADTPPTRAQIGAMIDEYVEAMLSLADAQHGKAPIPPARRDADAAFAKLDAALDAALTAEHEARARDAELGGKLLESMLERDGQYIGAGYLVTYSDDADLAAWRHPLREEGDVAERVFYEGPAEAFAWLAARAATHEEER